MGVRGERCVLPPEHFESSTLMMVREAWVISAQMRGNLCTRCFLASEDSVAEQKKRKEKKKKRQVPLWSHFSSFTHE